MFLLSKSHPFCIEALLLAIHLGPYMPVWPFKKKVAEAEEIPTEIVSYQRGDNSAGEVIDDTSHTEAVDYQAAMALFSSSVAKKDSENKSENFTWVSMMMVTIPRISRWLFSRNTARQRCRG